MTKEITTKVQQFTKYHSMRIYIPKSMYDDPQFPFKDGDEIIVKIEDNDLRIIKKTQTK